MRSVATRGAICLRDEATLVEYRVAFITYREWEDGSFRYEIEPCYAVTDLLEPPLFQGIPGINLELRRSVYVRENRTPVFVSERTPAENREDVRVLLDAEGLEYLNRLEWLIRTKTRYSGDSLYVRRRNKQDDVAVFCPGDMGRQGSRARDSMRAMLEALGRGQKVVGPDYLVDDKNRRVVHALLRQLYMKEKSYLDERRREGTQRAACEGKYPGRHRKQVDDIRLCSLCERHAQGELSAEAAASQLGVSVATFYRRYREFRERGD